MVSRAGPRAGLVSALARSWPVWGSVRCWFGGQRSSACRYPSAMADISFLVLCLCLFCVRSAFVVWSSLLLGTFGHHVRIAAFHFHWYVAMAGDSLSLFNARFLLSLTCGPRLLPPCVFLGDYWFSHEGMCSTGCAWSSVLPSLLLVLFCTLFFLCSQHQPVAQDSPSVPTRQQRLGVPKIRAVDERVVGLTGRERHRHPLGPS